MVNIIEENLRITIYLIDKERNFKKEISMYYVPCSGSEIMLNNGNFEVQKVVLATFGSVAYLHGVLRVS